MASHFDCRHIDTRCRRNRHCCSGICQRAAEGRPKTCRPHGTGTCLGGQNSCVGTGTICNSNSNCFCYVTTGDAAFCGTTSECLACKRDKDCVKNHGFPEGSACGICDACADGTNCIQPCA